MFFKTSSTFNFTTYETVTYYRLVESYRNALGQPCQRTILSLGKDIDGDLPFEAVAAKLNDMLAGKQALFPLEEKAEKFARYVFKRLVEEKKVDLVKKMQQQAKDFEVVDLQTIKNEDIRELGAEWMGVQAFQELGICLVLK